MNETIAGAYHYDSGPTILCSREINMASGPLKVKVRQKLFSWPCYAHTQIYHQLIARCEQQLYRAR